MNVTLADAEEVHMNAQKDRKPLGTLDIGCDER